MTTSVSDAGSFVNRTQILTLESTAGSTLTYSYEHFTIPDRFVISYEGNTLFDTGFTGGSTTNTIEVPAGTSNGVQVSIFTNDQELLSDGSK